MYGSNFFIKPVAVKVKPAQYFTSCGALDAEGLCAEYGPQRPRLMGDLLHVSLLLEFLSSVFFRLSNKRQKMTPTTHFL